MAQTTAQFGKRELNKAQTRQNILDAVYQLSREISFSTLKVKEIAEAAGVTEMTFFNYFQKKEDILKYMMGIWAYELLAQQQKHPLTGEAAIRRIFAHTAQLVNRHPRLVDNFVSSLLSSDMQPTEMQIEPVDRYFLHPDVAELHDVEIPSGNDMIMRHLAEIPHIKEPINVLIQLASAFYGDLIIAHTAQLEIQKLYTASLDRILADAQCK